MESIHCRVAETRREIDDALRLRWMVFEEELGYLGARPSPREVDGFDLMETTIHVVAYADGVAVGTGRLLLPNPEVARARGEGIGLDLEGRYDLGSLAAPGVSPAEVTRVCVVRAFRGAGVVEALIARMHCESARRGVTHWVAAANTQTDAAEDAALVVQVAAARGLVSSRYRLTPRPPSTPPSTPPATPTARLYDAEAWRRAAAGDLGGLPLPGPIAAFTRLGARICGPAVYDARFQRFAAPLGCALDEVNVAPTLDRAA